LVTGGLGFIGSNFIRYTLTKHKDIQIINLDNLSIGSNPANLKDVKTDNRYKFVKGDMADKTFIENLLNEADTVVNIAAETHVDRSIAEPWPFVNSNTIGAVNLFEAARKDRKRILHVSTDEIYGDIIQGSFREDDKLKPSSPYSASKAAADLFALAYHRTYGLDIVIARCTNNFGPYQFPEKLIPKTIIRTSLGLSVPIYGKGSNIRDWIYVQDFCQALDLLLNKGKSGEIYNISAGNELTNIDIVKKILTLLGKPENIITFVEDRPGHDLRYSLDSSKIRNELGWKPKHSLEEALKTTVNWYVHNEWWWKPIATEEVLHPTPWKLKW
jgi:dTDP-glucose 4,6-dehydratase